MIPQTHRKTPTTRPNEKKKRAREENEKNGNEKKEEELFPGVRFVEFEIQEFVGGLLDEYGEFHMGEYRVHLFVHDE